MTNRVLRLPEVLQQTGVSRSSVYRAIARGMFLRPIRLGLRASSWLRSEIDAWIAARIRVSRPGEENCRAETPFPKRKPKSLENVLACP